MAACALLRGADGRLDPRYRRDASHWTAAAYRRLGAAVFAPASPDRGPE